jgi:hypothetical protein
MADTNEAMSEKAKLAEEKEKRADILDKAENVIVEMFEKMGEAELVDEESLAKVFEFAKSFFKLEWTQLENDVLDITPEHLEISGVGSPKQRWSPMDKRLLGDMLARHEPIEKICEKLHRSARGIENQCLRLGLEYPKRYKVETILLEVPELKPTEAK